jgi:hypothetical protein
MGKMSKNNCLEDFILKNPELELLYSKLNTFNIFEIAGIVESEIKHSNFLAWLLNPNENHGIGFYFLKKFLTFLYSKSVNRLHLFDVESYGLNNVEVRREWKHIDLLIIIKENQKEIIIVIENKINSFEHGTQLTDYEDVVKTELIKSEKKQEIHYVYLIPDLNPNIEDYRKNWVNFEYSVVELLLEQTIQFHKHIINSEILNVLNQYLVIIKRYVQMNETEIKEICEKIWNNHKEALDILNNYRPNPVNQMQDKLFDYIQNAQDLFVLSTGRAKRWFSAVNFNLIEKKGITDFDNNLLFYYFDKYKDLSLSVSLYIGPGDDDLRIKLYEFLKENLSNSNIVGLRKFKEYKNENFKLIYNKQFYSDKNKDYDNFNQNWNQFLVDAKIFNELFKKYQ